jgi:tRNA threonylcarbamoyladenosine modification (KEOPS) complex  Pcc1 subunit
MPEGIKIQITEKKGELELIVKTKDVGSMIATLEDIFQCIQAAEITIKELT